MLVVVVVVVAMSVKEVGEKVASFTHTFGRTESKVNDVTQTISVASVDGIEENTEYFLKLNPRGKGEIDETQLSTELIKTHNTKKAFCVPTNLIRDAGILPGHTVTIYLFEAVSNKPQLDHVEEKTEVEHDASSDGWIMMDRCPVRHSNRNIDGYLESKRVYNHLKENGGRTWLMFVNEKNDNRYITDSEVYDSDHNRFSFGKSVQETIKAEPRDTIQVYGITSTETRWALENEKIDEMYEMVSELYEAYTAAKND